MKKVFPLHGIIGIVLLILSEIFHFKKIEPFYSWFYCFAWWSYILVIDAIIYRLKGNSLILSRTKEFFLMVPWSILIWLIFEAANLSLENWSYEECSASPPPYSFLNISFLLFGWGSSFSWSLSTIDLGEDLS
jgi:hypothetical protein